MALCGTSESCSHNTLPEQQETTTTSTSLISSPYATETAAGVCDRSRRAGQDVFFGIQQVAVAKRSLP